MRESEYPIAFAAAADYTRESLVPALEQVVRQSGFAPDQVAGRTVLLKPNLLMKRRPEEAGRWVNVAWVGSEQSSYQTSLEISAKDRDGLAMDVTMALSTVKVKVDSFAAKAMPDGYASVSIVLQVRDRDELTNVINKLGQISGVYQVKRAAG